MGLEMYAYKTKSEIADVDFDHPDDCVQIASWWKHPNLHGWMERLYVSKGGRQCFNCTPVQLGAKDLDALASAASENSLPLTTGFFFGESQPDDEIADEEFIAAAREALRDGYKVFYSSWW